MRGMSASITTVLDPLVDLERGPSRGTPPGDRPPSNLDRATSVSLESPAPPVRSAVIAMLGFILFESMLFAGLLGAFVVLRWGTATWPPAGQPRLPIGVTWINTAVLLGSCFPLGLGIRAHRSGSGRSFARPMTLAASMGALFLAVQGFEWTRLIAHGLTLHDGIYGGIFVLLIGLHAAHVLGAVLWLGTMAILASFGRIGPGRATALDLCGLYWVFVCALWPLLFGMVYLA